MPTPVIVSFDTEDYISPPADDALLRLARLLTAKGIRGSFCFVGEKARALRDRGRKDVIEALRTHEIGFHSRDHSVHPTIAPRCEELGWEKGLEDLRRTELPAIGWVKEVFTRERILAAVPAGSNCAAQAAWVYHQCGIPVYAGGFFGRSGADDQLYWYLGGLQVPYTFGADSKFATQSAEEAFERFSAQAGKPVAVLYIHPTILVHAKFWDAVNFPAGTNRPKELWAAAPLRPPEEVERIFERLGAFLDKLSADPRFEWCDYERLLADVHRRRSLQRIRAWSPETFAHLVSGPDWVSVPGDGALSPQAALGELAARLTGDPSWRERVSSRRMPGPVEAPPRVDADAEATLEQVRDELWRIQSQIGTECQGLPARWRLDGVEVGPGKFLSALAQATLGRDRIKVPAGVPEEPACVARTGLDRWQYGAWLFKPGFEGKENLRLARQMAWTLAPA